MQNTAIGTVPTDGAVGVNRLCGGVFNTIDTATAHITICSFATPFRVLVHFDSDEVINDSGLDAFDHIENELPTAGSGIGYTGFWLDYWQNTC